MLNVKLIVFLFYVAVGACRNRYCDICANHTLCKYPYPGPAPSCKRYSNALLSKSDIAAILHRINERRNSVALGRARRLPQAANMGKLVWSEQLATSAQRWADRCDARRPDHQDECRDLPNMSVGQNIASVLGTSPGLEVQSFVDLWYMQTLDYNGSVAYYNRYGAPCGSARAVAGTSGTACVLQASWLEDRGSTLVERVVCNFAPRGNRHGKPVYATGFPATQCPGGRAQDEHYGGLCSQTSKNQSKRHNPTNGSPSVSSLLRILISNNSANQDIDPIRNNLKYVKLDGNTTDSQRNQKLRHVMTNNSYAGNRAFDHQPQMHLYNKNPASNFRRPGFRQYQQDEKGHSRVYHDHEHKNNDIVPFKSSPEPDFRKYELTTELTVAYPPNDLRKHNQFLAQCTRKSSFPLPPLPAPVPLSPPLTVFQPVPPPIPLPLPQPLSPPAPPVGGCCPPNPYCYNRCAVGPLPLLPPPPPPLPPLPCAYPPPPLMPAPLPPPPPPLPSPPPIDLCPFRTPCIPNAYCHTGCQCLYENIPPPVYPSIARSQDFIASSTVTSVDDTRKSGGFHYYDLFPNLSVRSGDNAPEKSKKMSYDKVGLLLSKDNKHTTLSKKKIIWPIRKNTLSKFLKSVSVSYKIKDSPENKNDYLEYEKTSVTLPVNMYYHDNYNPHEVFDMIERKKRQIEDDNMRPFWRMDELNFKHPSHLKAMRYTTLSNKNKKIFYKNTAKYTEPITISLLNSHNEDHESHITEKFLSFDELMHLRKFNDENDYELLRQNKKTTTKKTVPPKKPAETKKPSSKTPTTTKKAQQTKATPTKKPPGNKTSATMKKLTTKTTVKENKNDDITVATPSGTYTTNTPFIRKKHCTRILTCTWTIATVTGQDGSVYNPGGNIGGSRTPPGYVEGCTRTSTCTRVFLNRNKVTQPSNDGRGSSGGSGEEDGEEGLNGDRDEDYCERRSLDVKQKSGDDNEKHKLIVREQKICTHNPLTISTYTIFSKASASLNTLTQDDDDLPSVMVDSVGIKYSPRFMPTDSTLTEKHDCLCYGDNTRKKRDVLSILQNRHSTGYTNSFDLISNEFVISHKKYKNQKYPFSYGDLFYLVLKKIIKTSNKHRNAEHFKVCHCSSAVTNKVRKSFLIIFLYFAVAN